MKLDIHVVNAFAKGPFTGNPAAVIVTDEPLGDELMQQIAEQNNLAETAYVVTGQGEPWSLRWFTPVKEVDLCGHATLAAAQVLFAQGLGGEQSRLRFDSRSGELGVTRTAAGLELDFPARPAVPDEAADREQIAAALGCRTEQVVECLTANWRVFVLDSGDTLKNLQPDMSAIAALHPFAIMATAPGSDCDFVARFFAPNAGIDEDPVTGSAYTTLAPYWAARLGKQRLSARQLSPRGGWLQCDVKGERVLIAGEVTPYLAGKIEV